MIIIKLPKGFLDLELVLPLPIVSPNFFVNFGLWVRSKAIKILLKLKLSYWFLAILITL